jgi:Ca2+-binding RTX toxin-like protein
VDLGKLPTSDFDSVFAKLRDHVQSAYYGAGLDSPPRDVEGKTVWILQSGAAGIEAASSGETNDVMVGWTTSDRLSGGGGDDLLIGDGGADLLDGGTGNDVLIGGAGVDRLEGGAGDDELWGGSETDVLIGGPGIDQLRGGTGKDYYALNAGDTAADIIVDPDRDNVVLFDGQVVAFGYRSGDSWSSPDGRLTLTLNSPLTISDASGASVIIEKWQEGDFGIRLKDRPQTPADVVLGDQDPDYLLAGDYLTGVPDVNVGYHWRAGQGDDFVNPQSLAGDLIEGNAGSDILVGGNGDDEVFGGERAELAAFIAESRTAQPTGERGDWVSGGLGDDIVAGAHGNDVIFGGGGADLLIGGAGDDVIDGDDNYLPADVEVTVASDIAERFYNAPFFDWSVDASDPFDAVFSPVVVFSRAREEGGADVIYAGAGDDIAYGLVGDDILYGEDGNDRLSGGIGDDDLWGAAEKIHRGMVAGNDCEMRRAA